MSHNIEPLLNEENFRLTVFPINKKYEIFYQMYMKQESSFWTASEIDFSKDYNDFITLSKDEQHFIKMILAFFAASDGIVNFNIRERFLQEIKVTEAQLVYTYQLMMDNIHGIIYSQMLDNIIKNKTERDMLFNAITTIDVVKDMKDWAFKWIHSDKSIGHRIIAFAIVEGVFFSGAFASIFWLKKQRNTDKLFMEGLIKSNRFIARDEGMHCNFACALYQFIENKLTFKEVVEIMDEAVKININFFSKSIQCKLIGININLMEDYIKYIADRLLIMLGYNKLYNTGNPFDFMESIGLASKENFFESRPDAYQKASNENNKETFEFKILDDF